MITLRALPASSASTEATYPAKSLFSPPCRENARALATEREFRFGWTAIQRVTVCQPTMASSSTTPSTGAPSRAAKDRLTLVAKPRRVCSADRSDTPHGADQPVSSVTPAGSVVRRPETTGRARTKIGTSGGMITSR